MKMMIKIVISLAIVSSIALSQGIEDALRLNNPNSVISARVAGLGTSYMGLVDDGSALWYNPAGLALIPASELSFGFGFTNQKEKTSYLGLGGDYPFTNNNENLTNFTYTVPINNTTGSRSVLALGVFRETDFNSNTNVYGFNRNTSFIEAEFNHGVQGNDNMIRRLQLADANGSLIQGNMLHNADIIENGGIYNLSAGFGFDVNESFSLGASLQGKFGSYNYSKRMRVSDTENNYNGQNSTIAFNRLDLNESIAQDLSGITGSVGFVAKVDDFVRITGTIQLPTVYNITEDYSRTAEAYFEDGQLPNPTEYQQRAVGVEYTIYTPFIYRGGVAFHAMGLTVSAGIEYSDQSQLEFGGQDFQNYPEFYRDLNLQITRQLKGRIEVGLGAEYKLPELPWIARVSYSQRRSPYFNDILGSNRDIMSFGGSWLFSKEVRIDGTFRYMNFTELNTLYGNGPGLSTFTNTRDFLDIALGITYRF